MHSIVVVNQLRDFDFRVEGIEVVTAKDYLSESYYAELKHVRIYNLCKSYKYQSLGYYVSLLAEARGHRVFPNITSIQDLKSLKISRIVSDDLDYLIQKSLSKLKSKKFILSIYFGKNLAKQYQELAYQFSHHFQAPLLRAHFVLQKRKWVIQNISPICIHEVPEKHKLFMMEAAKEYFSRKRIRFYRKSSTIYDLAILVNPEDKSAPSDEKAIRRFAKAAESIGLSTEIISKHDFDRIPEFDALFIRETTAVNHHTYRFSRRAHAEGLVVIDDPISIVRCTNKVYLNEILSRARIPTPKTVVVHRYNQKDVIQYLGLPCILKQPDSSASQGVVKVDTQEELILELERLLTLSDLIIAQQFTPSEFDWRIGILDRKLLYACKYYMVKNHWQISHWDKKKHRQDGQHETIALEKVPEQVIKLALKAANLIGNGLYGVDIKPYYKQNLVIEVNDNPSIESGVEDQILQDKLYLNLAHFFMYRIQTQKKEKEK